MPTISQMIDVYEGVIAIESQSTHHESATRVIGALAYDIRCCWRSDVERRIDMMYCIACEYGVPMPEMI